MLISVLSTVLCKRNRLIHTDFCYGVSRAISSLGRKRSLDSTDSWRMEVNQPIFLARPTGNARQAETHSRNPIVQWNESWGKKPASGCFPFITCLLLWLRFLHAFRRSIDALKSQTYLEMFWALLKMSVPCTLLNNTGFEVNRSIVA